MIKNSKKGLVPFILTLITGVIIYYLALPALSFKSVGFWIYIIIMLAVLETSLVIAGLADSKKSDNNIGMMMKAVGIVTTEGYNYIPQSNDNWIYTGVTSVGRDESNIGFILSNKRTKETIYYPVSGAEEYSAMSSAEGIVQHLGYTSTFPLLLRNHILP